MPIDPPYGWGYDPLSELSIADAGDMAFDYARPAEVPVLFFKQKTAYEILRSDWSSDVALPISRAMALMPEACATTRLESSANRAVSMARARSAAPAMRASSSPSSIVVKRIAPDMDCRWMKVSFMALRSQASPVAWGTST